MVTKYNIPCSSCGKIVERYIFCSGACKVKGHRERKFGTAKPIERLISPEIIEKAVEMANKEQKEYMDKPFAMPQSFGVHKK